MIREGKSRPDVAKALGVSEVSVGRYLTGERRPKPLVMLKIKSMTGNAVTSDDFLDQTLVAA